MKVRPSKLLQKKLFAAWLDDIGGSKSTSRSKGIPSSTYERSSCRLANGWLTS